MSETTHSLFRRLWMYQKERFPLFVNLIAVMAFTFSAIAYSRISRGAEGFVSLETYLIGCFATFTLFFLVRVFDEHKDKEDDAKYRSYLPVPRGLVSLKELRILGIIIGLAQIAVLAIFQVKMFALYAVVLVYLGLMGVEFFVPRFLRKHQVLYITSHMFIFPLLDVYSSGLDWLLNGEQAHFALIFFFIVSYLNGLLVEIGRKFKAPEDEEEGVISYTGLWGMRRAAAVWIALLSLTLSFALVASFYAGYGWQSVLVMGLLAMLCALPLFAFLRNPGKKSAKKIEIASGLWTIGMYLSLGGIPMLMKLLEA